MKRLFGEAMVCSPAPSHHTSSNSSHSHLNSSPHYHSSSSLSLATSSSSSSSSNGSIFPSGTTGATNSSGSRLENGVITNPSTSLVPVADENQHHNVNPSGFNMDQQMNSNNHNNVTALTTANHHLNNNNNYNQQLNYETSSTLINHGSINTSHVPSYRQSQHHTVIHPSKRRRFLGNFKPTPSSRHIHQLHRGKSSKYKRKRKRPTQRAISAHAAQRQLTDTTKPSTTDNRSNSTGSSGNNHNSTMHDPVSTSTSRPHPRNDGKDYDVLARENELLKRAIALQTNRLQSSKERESDLENRLTNTEKALSSAQAQINQLSSQLVLVQATLWAKLNNANEQGHDPDEEMHLYDGGGFDKPPPPPPPVH